ncbi:MAG TPA: hypothetical protein VLF69_03860 [Candidatus Saccharimonadales bacterium]|nr:hypothetical protein [Candidatus Saccharimonadales bacterium]
MTALAATSGEIYPILSPDSSSEPGTRGLVMKRLGVHDGLDTRGSAATRFQNELATVAIYPGMPGSLAPNLSDETLIDPTLADRTMPLPDVVGARRDHSPGVEGTGTDATQRIEAQNVPRNRGLVAATCLSLGVAVVSAFCGVALALGANGDRASATQNAYAVSQEHAQRLGVLATAGGAPVITLGTPHKAADTARFQAESQDKEGIAKRLLKVAEVATALSFLFGLAAGYRSRRQS